MMTAERQIKSNKRKSLELMVVFVVFTTTIAYIFGRAGGYGLGFLGLALGFSGLMALASYFWGEKLILSLHRAKALKKEDYPELFKMVENLSLAAALPVPKIYLIEDRASNAFATGRNPSAAAVAVTSGLLERLEKPELEGVLAHELSHIKNFDTRLMALTAVLAGSAAILADYFMRSLWFSGGRSEKNNKNNPLVWLGVITAILAPIIASLIQLMISRKREFLADAGSAELTRHPKDLALALEKISQNQAVLATASTATAHLYISNPLPLKLRGLFNTHPPIEERVKVLRDLQIF